MKENIVQKLTSKDDKYACGMMWGTKDVFTQEYYKRY